MIETLTVISVLPVSFWLAFRFERAILEAVFRVMTKEF
jgi:hypothetical protein